MNNLETILKDTREGLGLSIENISEILKIRKKYLYGIENWDFSNMPHKVYIMGYIRSYAKLMKLDSEKITNKFIEIYEHEKVLPIPLISNISSTPNSIAIIFSIVSSVLIYNLVV